MSKKLICLLIFGMVFFPACKSEEPGPPPPVVVKTMSIALQSPAGNATYSGSVRGRYESRLGFQVGGRIQTRRINLGDRVAAGDVLMEIDPKDLEETVRIASAQVDSAKSQLSLAETDFNRYERLFNDRAVSKAQFDQYKTAFDAASESLKQAEAQQNQALNALSYSRLTADADGVISAVEAEVGQVVAAGQPVVTLVKSNELEVEITVPENRISSLTLNQTVEASFWALPGFKVKGRVREISPVADMTTRTYPARVSFSSLPPEVQLGMTASVVAASSLNGTTPEVALLPLSAIYQTDGQPKVWLVKNARVGLTPVVTRDFDENQVVVISGLSDGDLVVTAGVHKLHEGQEVRLLGGNSK